MEAILFLIGVASIGWLAWDSLRSSETNSKGASGGTTSLNSALNRREQGFPIGEQRETPETWRTEFSSERITLSRSVRHVLQQKLCGAEPDASLQKEVMDAPLIGSDGTLTEAGERVALKYCPLSEQCERTGIPLRSISAEYHGDPEPAIRGVLTASDGSGIHDEGGSLKDLLFAMCFHVLADAPVDDSGRRLPNSHLYQSLWCYRSIPPDQVPDLETRMVDAARETSWKRIQTNWRDIEGLRAKNPSAAVQPYSWTVMEALYEQLPRSSLVSVLKLIVSEPFAYSKGWPDLAIASKEGVQFVEVKTSDKLLPSQLVTMVDTRRSAKLPVSVAQVRKQ